MRISRCGLPLIHNFICEIGGGTYDRRNIIRTNIYAFVRSPCRNHLCICLNYTSYNFEQIKKINHSAPAKRMVY